MDKLCQNCQYWIPTQFGSEWGDCNQFTEREIDSISNKMLQVHGWQADGLWMETHATWGCQSFRGYRGFDTLMPGGQTHLGLNTQN